MSKFYISSPLYYVNDKPHLGTAYSTVIADILNRYRKFFGQESFFTTGVDEHGQKCYQSAIKQKLSPQEHCDKMSLSFEKTWKALNIKYDLFFRTTHQYSDSSFLSHSQVVQKALLKLFDKGDIYSSWYKGWYCVSEEIFYTEKDLVDGKSPTGKPVTFLEEKTWFFKMSKYQKALQDHLEKCPDFIQPTERKNEILGFLKQPLQDLCISRPKTRVSWGVELPFDNSQVVYVWVDALLNYIVGAGYLNEPEEEFKNNWQEAETLHLIGKDILMTHAVYWSCLLLALDLPLPTKILAHGWLLNKDLEKMSKSKGDKLDPLELVKDLGVDGLRWFLAREVPLGKDMAFSKNDMVQKINEQLSDNLGNILNRVSKLIEKNFDGELEKDIFLKNPLKTLIETEVPLFEKEIKAFQLSQALKRVSYILVSINRYLEQESPWKKVKTDKKQAGFTLYNSLEALRIASLLIYPVMPDKIQELFVFLGTKEIDFKKKEWGSFSFGKIEKAPILFPKIDGGDGRI